MSRVEIESSPATLLIRHSDTWPAEHRYIFSVLLREHLGLDYQLQAIPGMNWVEILCAQASTQRALVVGANLLLQPRAQWLTSASMPLRPLTHWDPRSLLPDWKLGSLPVLYPPAYSVVSGRPATESIWLPLDVLGGAFFLLTRYEELVVKTRDQHLRFPAAESIGYKESFLLRPLVDEYAELLRQALMRAFPGLQCRRQQPRIRLSHDVDHPFQFFGKSLKNMAISAGKRLYHYPRLREAWRLLQAGRHAGLAGDASADPFNTYERLMDASEALETPAEFYFMTGVTNTRYDEPYNLLEPELQKTLRKIHGRGHSIGLHASYNSFQSEQVLSRELGSLRNGAERAGIELRSVGGRQHYLRWEMPTTWRCWNDAGLDYDATLGFPEHVGFRCGTAREFPAFDPTASRELRLRERPLIAMDVTMTECMGLCPDGVLKQLGSLWSVVRSVGGTLEVLIHNCNPRATWFARSLVGIRAGFNMC